MPTRSPRGERGIEVARVRGDKQAGKEMAVFARRVAKRAAPRLRRGRLQHRRDAAVGERIGALVARVVGVALHPVPADRRAARVAASSSRHSSAFFTGFLSLVFQPLRFQPWIHVSMPCFTYCESV